MKPTPVLDGLHGQGLEVFLYSGQLAAMVSTGGPLPEATADYIRKNKEKLIAELKSKTAPGEIISFDKFIDDRRGENPVS